jgi:hypothetical protein
MLIRDVTNIYIIESPSNEDISENRKEGQALSEALKLASIKNKYFVVGTINEFSHCFDSILETELKNKNKGKVSYVTLHFSMHGNNKGIALTNNEVIIWKDLYNSYLKKLITTLGYQKSKNGSIVAPIHLHFSTCNGIYAKVITTMDENSPYISLVGPNTTVNWSDSLVAFIILYHNTIHKENGPQKSVQLMNAGAGVNNVFEIDLAKGFHFIK